MKDEIWQSFQGLGEKACSHPLVESSLLPVFEPSPSPLHLTAFPVLWEVPVSTSRVAHGNLHLKGRTEMPLPRSLWEEGTWISAKQRLLSKRLNQGAEETWNQVRWWIIKPIRFFNTTTEFITQTNVDQFKTRRLYFPVIYSRPTWAATLQAHRICSCTAQCILHLCLYSHVQFTCWKIIYPRNDKLLKFTPP